LPSHPTLRATLSLAARKNTPQRLLFLHYHQP
jgi:hypothetical protein